MSKWICRFRCEHITVSKCVVTSLCTSLTIGVPSSVLYTQSAGEHPEPLFTLAVCVSLLALSLVMYFVTSCTDPGYLPMDTCLLHQKNVTDASRVSQREVVLESSSMLTAMDNDPSEIHCRWCSHCGIQQPMRSKHCDDCGRCVCKYDHHCPWLDTCVGERNHKFFWIFLLSTSLLAGWTLIMAINSVSYRPLWSGWFRTNAVLLVDILILLVAGSVTIGLLLFHTFLMVRGWTTWEVASREHISYLKYLYDDCESPFDEGSLTNMQHFLCSSKPSDWEAVYVKQTKMELSLA